MKSLKCLLVLSVTTLLGENLMSANFPEYRIYVGSQKRLGGKGIYSFRLDADAKPTDPVLLAESDTPSFIAIHPSEKYIYAVSETGVGKPPQGAVLAFKLDAKEKGEATMTLINRTNSGGAGPCHISLSIDARSLFVAHYSDGKVASLPINADGSLGETNAVIQHEGSVPDSKRQTSPHAHCIKPEMTGKFALSCDLGADKIFVHPIDKESGKLLPSISAGQASKIGAGPRHFAFDADNRHIYVANELDNTVAAYTFNAVKGELSCVDSASALPEDYSDANTLSEIVIHPSGKWLYTANRGLDSIAVFSLEAGDAKLKLIAQVPCGGKVPRHFHVDPTGKILLTANQNSGNVAVFLIDPKTGIPKATGDSVEVPGASCIVFGK